MRTGLVFNGKNWVSITELRFLVLVDIMVCGLIKAEHVCVWGMGAVCNECELKIKRGSSRC